MQIPPPCVDDEPRRALLTRVLERYALADRNVVPLVLDLANDSVRTKRMGDERVVWVTGPGQRMNCIAPSPTTFSDPVRGGSVCGGCYQVMSRCNQHDSKDVYPVAPAVYPAGHTRCSACSAVWCLVCKYTNRGFDGCTRCRVTRPPTAKRARVSAQL